MCENRTGVTPSKGWQLQQCQPGTASWSALHQADHAAAVRCLQDFLDGRDPVLDISGGKITALTSLPESLGWLAELVWLSCSYNALT